MSKPGSAPRTYKVHETDVFMTGSWVMSAFGPVEHGGVDGVRNALRAAMSVGPSARVGLVPNTSTREWAYEPARVLGAVRVGSPITSLDYPSAMAETLASRRADEPVSVMLRGDHVIVLHDHGIGDGQMTLNLSLTVSSRSAREGKVPEWAAAGIERRPLIRSAVELYGRDPRRVLGLRPQRAPSQPTLDQVHDAPELIDWTPSHSVAYASSPEASTRSLTKWRETHAPDVSLSALMFATLALAFKAEGIPVDNTLGVLFNVRRYLPATRTTLANLSAGVPLRLSDPTDPHEIGRALARTSESGYPIAELVVGSLKSKLTRLARLKSRASGVRQISVPQRIRLIMTDMGRAPQMNQMDWSAGPDDTQYAAMVNTAGPEYVTIAMVRRGNAIKVSASFHSNVLSADAVQSALTRACMTSTELLESAVNA